MTCSTIGCARRKRGIVPGPPPSLSAAATGVVVRSLREEELGRTESLLYILLGAASFVLLVACTNLASTLLARGTTQAAEIAVRSAVGASKGRIVRQMIMLDQVSRGPFFLTLQIPNQL